MSADAFTGRVIITWQASRTLDYVPGHGVMVTDADSGEPLVSALDLTITVDLRAAVTATMTMLTDEDGKPLIGNHVTPLIAEDGESYRTGVFRWLVTEMRTATERGATL